MTTEQIFIEHGFRPARLLAYSKSVYRAAHPDNEVHFNANIFIDGVKIWYGDLDLTLDLKKLTKLANNLQKDLYIMREVDGWSGEFDENKVIKTICHRVDKTT